LNHLVRLVFANLFIGLSHGWWTREHNQHHVHSNRDLRDPDIALPHLAYNARQAAAKPRHARPLVRLQGVLFVPLWCLHAVYLQAATIEHLACARPSRRAGGRWSRRLEVAVLAAHFAGLFAIPIALHGVGRGLLYVAAQQLAFGFFAGSVFSPGHNGMPVLDPGARFDFVRAQVLTTRSLRPGFFADFWYGGLNHQIEHHLFPTMSRCRLREAQRIVKEHCRERSIPYHETGPLESYVEMIRYLSSVRRPVTQ
jgi:fatty acid desaturase